MAYRGSNLPAHEGSPDRIHEAPQIAPGQVAALHTVTVKTRIDGRLLRFNSARHNRSMPERAMHPADEQAGA